MEDDPALHLEEMWKRFKSRRRNRSSITMQFSRYLSQRSPHDDRMRRIIIPLAATINGLVYGCRVAGRPPYRRRRRGQLRLTRYPRKSICSSLDLCQAPVRQLYPTSRQRGNRFRRHLHCGPTKQHRTARVVQVEPNATPGHELRRRRASRGRPAAHPQLRK